ncbi:Hypothetical protein PHPALM_17901 [Phytophthora palmivora]|uniref:Uncharacterized protein n=1 Tax=Phytophthora palmivora TaxID=4796 RepID=A0A2P4XL64_9STRA|nr:Hypothetical protein PHPALM_17901 [Phytophthora palmivora]
MRADGAKDVVMDISSCTFDLVLELKYDVIYLVDHCNEILVDHVVQWPNLQKVKVYAEDVEHIELSMIYPFNSATIAFANNLRCEPPTT